MIYSPIDTNFIIFNGNIDAYKAPQVSSVNQLAKVNTRTIDQFKYISFEIIQGVENAPIDLSVCNYVIVSSGPLLSSSTGYKANMHSKIPQFTETCYLMNILSTTTASVTETTTSITSSRNLYEFRLQMRLNSTFDNELNSIDSRYYKLLKNSILDFCGNALSESNITLFISYEIGAYTSEENILVVDWFLLFDSVSSRPEIFQNDLTRILNDYSKKTFSVINIVTDSIQITYNGSFVANKKSIPDLNDFNLKLELKILSNFTEDLYDQNSNEFKRLALNIDLLVASALEFTNNFNGYKGLRINKLTPGSILVDAVLFFDNKCSPDGVFNSIITFIIKKESILPIDSESIKVFDSLSSTTSFVMSTTTTTTTTTESTTSYHFLPKEVVKAITPMSELNLKMKISSTFNSNLNNSTSSEYKNLTDLIKTEISTAMKNANLTDYIGIQINSFKEGSILIDSTLMFNKPIDSSLIKNTLKSYFTSSKSLNVDANTISVILKSNESSSDSSSSNDVIIAAIVIPIGVFFVLLAIGSVCLFKRYKKRKTKKAVKVDDASFRPPLNPYEQMSKNKPPKTKLNETIINEEDKKSIKSSKSYSKSERISVQDNSIDIMKTESFNRRLEEMEMNNLTRLKLTESNATLNESSNELDDYEDDEDDERKENDAIIEEQNETSKYDESRSEENETESEKSLDFSKIDETIKQVVESPKEEKREKQQDVSQTQSLSQIDSKMSQAESLKDSLPNQYFESKLPEAETIVINNMTQLVDDDITSDTGTEDNYTHNDDIDDDDEVEVEDENENEDDGKTIHI